MAKKAKKTKAASKKSVAVKVKAAKTPDMTLAIVALILNIIFPGVGSLVGSRVRAGIWQIALVIVGGVLATVLLQVGAYAYLVGILVMAVACIWALVTGIQLILAAK
ncbi:MAG: hypothetical protein ABIE22_05650 [archaeon]